MANWFYKENASNSDLTNQTMIIYICISRQDESFNEKSSELGRIQIFALVCNSKVLITYNLRFSEY